MASLPLITPSECVVVLGDYQAGLAFAAGSADRQGIRSAALALAKTAVTFSVPVVVSTSATKVYSGPLMPPLRAVLKDVVPIERRNMNLWEDEAAKAAVVAMGRRTLVVAGLLTEACDWTRRETYEAARAIVVEHAGGYGIGLDYARDMIKPA
jgi:nicotinamidase-related amidase